MFELLVGGNGYSAWDRYAEHVAEKYKNEFENFGRSSHAFAITKLHEYGAHDRSGTLYIDFDTEDDLLAFILKFGYGIPPKPGEDVE